MLTKATAPNWAELIDQMVRAGRTWREISARTGSVLSDRVVKHYAKGVQPLHWRGEAILAMWCEVTGKKREDVPTLEVTRGHRAERRNRQVITVNLPAWPPAPAAKPVAHQRRETLKLKKRQAEAA